MTPCRFDSIVHACGHETLQHREGPYPSCHEDHPQEFRERYATDATFCVQQFCGDPSCDQKPLNARAITNAVKLLRDRLIEHEKKMKELNDALIFMATQSPDVPRPAPLEHAGRCVHKVYSNLAMMRPYVDNVSDYILSGNHRKVFTDAFKMVVGHLDTIPSCIKEAEQQVRRMPAWKAYVEDRPLPGLAGAPLKPSAPQKPANYTPKRLCASLSLGFKYGSSPPEETHPAAQVARAVTPIPGKTWSKATTPANNSCMVPPTNTPVPIPNANIASGNVFIRTEEPPRDPFPEAVPHFLDDEMEDDNWHVWRYAGTDEEKRLAIKYESLMKELGTNRMPKILEEARHRESRARAGPNPNFDIAGLAQRMSATRITGPPSIVDPRSQYSGNITPLSSATTSHRNSPTAQGIFRGGNHNHLNNPYGISHNQPTPAASTGFGPSHRLAEYGLPTTTGHRPTATLTTAPKSASRISRLSEVAPVNPEERRFLQNFESLMYASQSEAEASAEFPVGTQFTNTGVFIPFPRRQPTFFGFQEADSYASANTATGSGHWDSIYGNSSVARPTGAARGNSGHWADPSNTYPTTPYPPPPSVLTPVDSMLGTPQLGTVFYPQEATHSKPSTNPHLCSRCNKTWPSISELFTHRQACQAIKCAGCGEICADGVELFEHRRNCPDNKYKIRVSEAPKSSPSIVTSGLTSTETNKKS